MDSFEFVTLRDRINRLEHDTLKGLEKASEALNMLTDALIALKERVKKLEQDNVSTKHN